MTFATDIVAGFLAIRSATGVSVTVSRGTATATAVAVPANSNHQYLNSGLVVNEVMTRDFMFLASDYDFGDGPVEPARGDTINDGSQTYRVLADAGEVHFRWSDQHKQIFRVHTKPVN